MGSRSDDPQDLGELRARLAALEERVATLERGQLPIGHPQPAVLPPSSSVATDLLPGAVSGESSNWLLLAGRALLVLGGGFLLRALTEAEAWPLGLGVGLGLAYGVVWLLWAHHDARDARPLAAIFDALASALLLFPLLWESTRRFGVVGEGTNALLVGATAATGLLLAWHHRLHLVAWIMAGSAAMSAVAHAVVSPHPAPFLGLLLAVALAVLWLGYACGWMVLAWLLAALADFALALTSIWFVASALPLKPGGPSLGALVALELALPGAYLASFAARTLPAKVAIATLEMAQTAVALLVGVGGALVITNAVGHYAAAVGLGAVVVGLGCYAAAFTFVSRRHGRRRNFRYYATVAMALCLSGLAVVLSGTPLALVYVVAALFVGWAGAKWQRVTLSGHAAAYLIAAALSGKMVAASLGALVGRTPEPRAWLGIPLVVLVAALVLASLRVVASAPVWGRLDKLPELLLIVVASLGLLGASAALLVGIGRTALEGPLPPPLLAIFRTAVLAIGAPLAALLARSERYATVRLVVYPVLVLGGLKLLLEDTRSGTTLSLVASLLLYGGALIATARWMRRGGPTDVKEA